MAVFNASFQTDGSAFSASFNGNAVFTVGMAEQVVIEIIEAERYEGLYEVTPTRQEQVLSTANKTLIENVVVNPIPKNYGLITWNGAVMTVS